MRNRFSLAWFFVFVFSMATMLSANAIAQETVLHTFASGHGDGEYPVGGLIRDAAGNLYGTTGEGGAFGYGDVYELSPNGSGAYKEKILHSFNFNGTDGFAPYAGVILSTSGDIFGTTSVGGTGACGNYNCGTVFELMPQSNGTWKERIIYNFQNNGTDGNGPLAGLVMDPAGNLYGTTAQGGTANEGAVFQLGPKAGGGWTERVLHSFSYNGKQSFDGDYPESSLAMSSAGNLFGTTRQGGQFDYGTLFEIVHTAGGWGEKVIHSFDFNGNDGATPLSGVTLDASGNIYGTTNAGGDVNLGSVYEFVAESEGKYSENIFFTFDGIHSSGPYGGVVLDASGNIYGTTTAGGSSGNGTLFKLTPLGNGSWSNTILYAFATGGYYPDGNIAIDSVGNIYGTTQYGGSGHDGVVYEVTQ